MVLAIALAALVDFAGGRLGLGRTGTYLLAAAVLVLLLAIGLPWSDDGRGRTKRPAKQ